MPPRFGMDVALYDRVVTENSDSLQQELEKTPFSEFRKNKKKVRTLVALLSLFLHLQRWLECKVIISYAFSHRSIIRALCASLCADAETIAWNLGDWLIRHFGRRSEMQPVYTALVRVRYELFYELMDRSLCNMIKPRDLVKIVTTNRRGIDEASFEFFETVCAHLKFSGSFACLRKKLCTIKFIESCIFFGNVRMLTYIWNHYEFVYKVDYYELFSDPDYNNNMTRNYSLTFLRPPLAHYSRFVEISGYSTLSDCLKYHDNWIVIDAVLAFDLVWILQKSGICYNLDTEVYNFLLEKKMENIKSVLFHPKK